MIFVQAALGALLATFGGAIMCLEILASSLMAPWFGGSIYIWGSIISSFMVHLALGYVLGGWLSRRSPRASTLLAMLAFASLWIMGVPWLSPAVCGLLADSIFDVRFGSLAAMNIIFFVPIMLMGTTSPYVIGLLAAREGQQGIGAGVVLFLSTLGSFFGANLTAFYFIDAWPVSRIILGLGAFCLVLSLGLMAVNLDGRLAGREEAGTAKPRR